MYKATILTFLQIWLYGYGAFATPQTLVLNTRGDIPLIDHISYFDDTSATVSINDIVEQYNNGCFVSGDKIPDQVHPGQSIWLHITLSVSDADNTPWMLHFNSSIAAVDVYALVPRSDGSVDTMATHVESVNNYHKLQALINPIAGAETEYFIRLHLLLPQNCTVKQAFLTPQDLFIAEYITQSTLIGVLWGIMLLLLVYYILKFIAWRQRLYLYYILYIIFHLTFAVHGSILLEVVIAPGRAFSSLSWLYNSFSFGVFFYVLFVREYIELKTMNNKLDRLFYVPYIWFLILSNIAMVILSIVGNEWFYAFYLWIPIVYAVLGLTLVILLLFHAKQLEVRLVLIGSCITIITGISQIVVDELNLVDNNHIYNVGMVTDLLFYSFAISLKEKRLLKQAEARKEELRNIRTQFELKQRELASKALYISQQDSMLLQLKEQMENVAKSDDVASTDMSQVLLMLEQHVHNNSWEEFERYFIEVHPSFYESLKEAYPQLTQNELRICALLKLNLNTKQIADITQKSAKSIDVTRSRIRSKMNLQREDSLFDAIALI